MCGLTSKPGNWCVPAACPSCSHSVDQGQSTAGPCAPADPLVCLPSELAPLLHTNGQRPHLVNLCTGLPPWLSPSDVYADPEESSRQVSSVTTFLELYVLCLFLPTSRFVSCVSVSSDSSIGPESSWFSAESNQEEAADTAAYRSCCSIAPPKGAASLLSLPAACEAE